MCWLQRLGSALSPSFLEALQCTTWLRVLLHTCSPEHRILHQRQKSRSVRMQSLLLSECVLLEGALVSEGQLLGVCRRAPAPHIEACRADGAPGQPFAEA